MVSVFRDLIGGDRTCKAAREFAETENKDVHGRLPSASDWYSGKG